VLAVRGIEDGYGQGIKQHGRGLGERDAVLGDIGLGLGLDRFWGLSSFGRKPMARIPAG
jgi:hypothetical protein